jgi:hypothetical protein
LRSIFWHYTTLGEIASPASTFVTLAGLGVIDQCRLF